MGARWLQTSNMFNHNITTTDKLESTRFHFNDIPQLIMHRFENGIIPVPSQ